MNEPKGRDLATDSEIERKLAEVRARRAALAEAAEQRLQPTPEERLAIEQRELAEDEALDAAAREHGARAVMIVRSDVGAVIVKRPHLATFRRFQETKNPKCEDLEKLVRPCLVYPSRDRFDLIIAELPFMLNRCADAVSTLAGVRRKDIEEKS